jgi:hypothetical protein
MSFPISDLGFRIAELEYTSGSMKLTVCHFLLDTRSLAFKSKIDGLVKSQISPPLAGGDQGEGV